MKYKEINSKDEGYIPFVNDFSDSGKNRPKYFEFKLGGEPQATGMYKDIHEDCERRSQQRLNSKDEGYIEGFSLLEVLITLIILSVGILSIAKLQTTSLIRNYNAYLYSVASEQIASIFERAEVGVANKELPAWQKAVALSLPQGQGEYNNNTQTISVCWYNRLSYTVECLKDQQ